MNTSRKEGLLVFNTTKPYKFVVDGKEEDYHEIICHEVTSKCENTAYDLEQMLLIAMAAIEKREIKASKKQLLADEKKENKFYETESPTIVEIDEQANQLQLMVKMNNEVKMSELMDCFWGFVAAGKIRCVGDQPMTPRIWETISRQDKVKILFRYCAFFVNPLESLRNIVVSTESQG